MIGYIYVIRNKINSRVYIGQTIRPISKRFEEHIANTRGEHLKLYKAIKKYGSDNFYIELIEECDSKLLNEREIYWISYFNSYKNGYNSTPGGNAPYSKLEDDIDDIIQLYKSGYSSLYIARKYNCSDITILTLLSANKVKIRTQSKQIICVELNKIFVNYSKCAEYLISENIPQALNKWTVVEAISKACKYKNKYLNMHFLYCEDIDKYYKQFNDWKNEYDNIKECKVKCKTKCKVDKTSGKKIACRICGKPITSQSKTGMCNACSNVVAKGKSPKPSREELKQLLDAGIQKKQIASMYGRTDSTIHYWIKSYNLR
jgi:group I intron endonuclease